MEEREMRLLDHKLPLHSPLPSLSSWSINNINLTGHFSGNSINFAIDILQNFQILFFRGDKKKKMESVVLYISLKFPFWQQMLLQDSNLMKRSFSTLSLQVSTLNFLAFTSLLFSYASLPPLLMISRPDHKMQPQLRIHSGK